MSPPPTRLADSYIGGATNRTGNRPSACTIGAQVAGACVLDSVTHFSPLNGSTTSPFTTGNRDRFGLQAGGGAGPGRYFLSGERQSEMGHSSNAGHEEQVFTTNYGHAPAPARLHPNSLNRTNLRATAWRATGRPRRHLVSSAIRSAACTARWVMKRSRRITPVTSGARSWLLGGFRPSITFATRRGPARALHLRRVGHVAAFIRAECPASRRVPTGRTCTRKI